ncbi:delta-aminolevulinic acid dehydratase [Winogradskyella alexanderae]|uniref:Delta-aminolevulinic acid dehydratase n=1 Tax=Winogradskyella alexanderae TaxID=2877123 RepID=A0ABS7XPB4_9FLAO|nr:delta-aminolevulinic acid dehydratase [Winogradskyella alexanderae]MCA0131303.1 delta-aminolevulinic acid dehydratase [Winogradskyella alexanderae]
MVRASFDKLKSFCENEGFKGWDPYDGLNSCVIQKTPLGKSRFLRLVWIQLFKRSPINLRNLFFVKKDYNPKGLGLFLIGYCNLYKKEKDPKLLETIDFLASEIMKLRTKSYKHYCWGYNFDWQARAFFQPKYTPTVVATTFISEALIEAYRITNNRKYLEATISASKFIQADLNRSFDSDGDFTFSYSPLDKTQVYNAGLLGAKQLSMVYSFIKDENLLKIAKSVINYVCKKQNKDGSWAYGTLPYHQWVDNFHTGYNLECIKIYQDISGDLSYKHNLLKGMSYYLNTFFTEEGLSKYYNNQTYPIDIHSPAQLVVTLYKNENLTSNKKLVDNVLNWTIDNMQTKKGYFIYQKRKFFSSRIPYIRWAQAWMFYALSYYLLDDE